VDKLGSVDAEMFISMMRQNTFDYTEWQQNNLWQDMSISEILKLVKDREKTRKNNSPEWESTKNHYVNS